MRLLALLFTAMLVAGPASGRQAVPSPGQDATAPTRGQSSGAPAAKPVDPAVVPAPLASGAADGPLAKPADNPRAEPLDLPVSLDRIKGALEQTPLLSLRTIDERPTFTVQIRERTKLEELLASLDYKTGPTPAGGIYMAEQQRIMFPSVDNPLAQPLAAFNQGELLTILIENVARGYLGGRALDSISKAERARAEAAAREEVRTAVDDYCRARPNAGAGIAICTGGAR